jgi:hypothetical protein
VRGLETTSVAHRGSGSTPGFHRKKINQSGKIFDRDFEKNFREGFGLDSWTTSRLQL